MPLKQTLFGIYLMVYCALSDINLDIYNNSVFNGQPAKIVALQSLSYSIPSNSNPISAQILGSIEWPDSINLYYFNCMFGANLFGFVWIDDHLICAPNVYDSKPIFASWNLTNTFSAYTTRKSFIRIDLYSQPEGNLDLDFTVRWSFNNNNSLQIINNTYLSTVIPLPQQQRMKLQNNLIQNTFSTWYYNNILTTLRLPDSFGFTFGVCSDSSARNCLLQTQVENNLLWVGVHANDHSYYEYNLSWNGYDFQYQYSSVIVNKTYSNFYSAIKLLSNKNHLPFISFSSRFYYNRSGTVSFVNNSHGEMNCFMNMRGYGLPQYFEICSNINSYTKNNNELLFQFSKSQPIIYFTTDLNINSVTDIAMIINKLQVAEYATYEKYGNLSDTKMGIQSVLMYDTIYTPEEAGPIAPVSRSWAESISDFSFIIFDWDNIFASYQMSLDNLDLAISNLIQVIKSKTVNGFVPNFKLVNSGGYSVSEDRTEPEIGSMVLYKMYNKYGDDILWLIELLFDDLYDWLDWFWRRRRCPTKYLICLGSDPTDPDNDGNQNNMQDARYESGLDNSPMYDIDNTIYNTTTHHMQLYDVGMNGMYINELQKLMILGKAINVSSTVANVLNERYEVMVNATMNELWDDSMGIFVNKFSTNNSFYVRISPTSFYPLISGVPTVKQAEMMVNNYLLSPNYFCISLTFPVNQTKDCYYGLPSISFKDPAFNAFKGYWTGFTWGPMSQLVWWGLDPYIQQSDIVKSGQEALMKQMNAMMLNIWNSKRHICENYSPANSVTDCTGDHFYHWGGLTGFLSLIHDYY